MCEKEEKRYQELLEAYREKVISRMGVDDYARYSEALFSAHSCGIEGNSYSVDDTRALMELSLGVVPVGKPLVETMEMLDHLHAFDWMTEHMQDKLSEDFILHLHSLLTCHTISYLHPDAKPGEYTTVDMGAGDTLFGDHLENIGRVPNLLASTQKAIDDGHLPAMYLAAMFHGYFIFLHPFRDGNGRLGRLLSNKILLQKGHPLLIIPREKCGAYIKALKLFHKDSVEHLVYFFYLTAIERMETEMKNKQANGVFHFLF